MTNITIKEVRTAILSGALDADIPAIKAALEGRKEMLATAMRSSLSVGDTVTFTDTCRPTYMRGLKATVIKINRERVVVDLLKPAGRFHKNITCPVSILSV
jgi:uncharacterized protein YkvS